MVDLTGRTGRRLGERYVSERSGHVGRHRAPGDVRYPQSDADLVLEYRDGGGRLGRLGRTLVHRLAGFHLRPSVPLVPGRALLQFAVVFDNVDDEPTGWTSESALRVGRVNRCGDFHHDSSGDTGSADLHDRGI